MAKQRGAERALSMGLFAEFISLTPGVDVLGNDSLAAAIIDVHVPNDLFAAASHLRERFKLGAHSPLQFGGLGNVCADDFDGCGPLRRRKQFKRKFVGCCELQADDAFQLVLGLDSRDDCYGRVDCIL
ncbi:hypothetical protein ACLB0R_01245 [Sphingomonas sp. GlSt437]|uniref:hypothetical protein n=1 Tax=Sphingomonas sp. GlSt437 TaxID=3389970 RepID=UPI003A85F116